MPTLKQSLNIPFPDPVSQNSSFSYSQEVQGTQRSQSSSPGAEASPRPSVLGGTGQRARGDGQDGDAGSNRYVCSRCHLKTCLHNVIMKSSDSVADVLHKNYTFTGVRPLQTLLHWILFVPASRGVSDTFHCVHPTAINFNQSSIVSLLGSPLENVTTIRLWMKQTKRHVSDKFDIWSTLFFESQHWLCCWICTCPLTFILLLLQWKLTQSGYICPSTQADASATCRCAPLGPSWPRCRERVWAAAGAAHFGSVQCFHHGTRYAPAEDGYESLRRSLLCACSLWLIKVGVFHFFPTLPTDV